MSLDVESMQDCVLARAAIDGVMSVYGRGTHITTGLQPPPPPTDAEVNQQANVTILPVTLTGIPHNGDGSTANPGPLPPIQPENPASEAGDQAEATGFSKEQIKAASAANPTLAALVAKKGRKSATEKALIETLVAQTLGVPVPASAAPPVGAALAGATAQDLQAALAKSTTVVHSEPGIEVRVPNTAPAAETPASPPPAATEDVSIAALLAANKNKQPEPAAAAAPSAPQAKQPEQMSNEELYAAIQSYADNGGGLFWFRTVIERGGGDQNKLSADYMRQVLAAPQKFFPGAVV